jgi:hypothetical protein
MSYEIIKEKYYEPVLVINTPEGQDFRNDAEITHLLTQYKNVNLKYQHSLDWLPNNVIKITVSDIYAIDYKDKQIYLLKNIDQNIPWDSVDNPQRFSNNKHIIDYMLKFKKVVCYANVPLDWLPNGITHLEINNQLFNQPLDNLPNSLIYLSICGGKPFFNERSFNQSLDNLPFGLKCLYLANLESQIPLNNLPSTLEYLFIEQTKYDLPLDNLPLSLKKCFVYTDKSNYEYKDYVEIQTEINKLFDVDI